MNEPKFPIALLLTDCGETRVHESLADLQDALELIDVENHEYLGWDFEGRPLRFSVASGQSEGAWLSVEISSEQSSVEECVNATRRYANAIGFPFEMLPSESPVDYVRRVEDWAGEHGPRARPLWSRLLGLVSPRRK